MAADDGAQRAAAGQQAVTAAMRVLLIALATALVLRTGALQFFVSALSGAAKSSGGSAGATSAGAAAAAASAFLVPGLRRRLLSPAAQLLGALGTVLPLAHCARSGPYHVLDGSVQPPSACGRLEGRPDIRRCWRWLQLSEECMHTWGSLHKGDALTRVVDCAAVRHRMQGPPQFSRIE